MEDGRVSKLKSASNLVGVWTSDTASKMVIADQRVCEYFNVDIDRGQSGAPLRAFMKAVHPDDRMDVSRLIALAMAEGSSFQASYRVLSTAYGLRQVHATGQCFHNRDGQCTHLSGYLLDADAIEDGTSEPAELLSAAIEHLMQARDLVGAADEPLLRKLIEAVMLEAGFRLSARFKPDGKGGGNGS